MVELADITRVLAFLCLYLAVTWLIAWSKASLSYRLIRLRGKLPTTFRSLSLLAFCIASITCFSLRLDALAWYEIAGLIAASFLAYIVLFPATQFREHGIHDGLRFIPWHNISRFSWHDRGKNFASLALEGPWLGKLQILVRKEQQDLANGIITGAARLEPTPQWRVQLSIVLRCSLILATATAGWLIG